MAFGWSIITEQKLKIAKPEGVSNSSKISSYSPHLKKRGEASPPCGLSGGGGARERRRFAGGAIPRRRFAGGRGRERERRRCFVAAGGGGLRLENESIF
jgi:hypothetical protein